MKIGVVTDVHGNLEALEAVLHALDTEQVDIIWSLGDMIAMGPDSNAVMERLIDRGAHMISGNHDEAVVSLLAGKGHPESYAHTRPHHEWVARHLWMFLGLFRGQSRVSWLVRRHSVSITTSRAKSVKLPSSKNHSMIF
ncbi:metallophosphoesterase [Exiguobacterium sp. s129]|uniref:metallophosphoesterase family protein n=1 Tax=Exiguobacterium sp. s129 TaxID=2751264 RepID=UPI002036DB53|nr:metallophosphoesterase [Exiguobacterium sp. s129]